MAGINLIFDATLISALPYASATSLEHARHGGKKNPVASTARGPPSGEEICNYSAHQRAPPPKKKSSCLKSPECCPRGDWGNELVQAGQSTRIHHHFLINVSCPSAGVVDKRLSSPQTGYFKTQSRRELPVVIGNASRLRLVTSACRIYYIYSYKSNFRYWVTFIQLVSDFLLTMSHF